MFSTHCEHCEAEIEVPNPHHADTIRCTACGKAFEALRDEERTFKFHCPACDQHIEATMRQIGKIPKCPTCGKRIFVPDPREQIQPKSAAPEGENLPAASAAGAEATQDSWTAGYGVAGTISEILGIVLIGFGAWFLIDGFGQEVTAPGLTGPDPALLHDRSTTITLGGTLTLSGAVFLASGFIARTITAVARKNG